MEVDKCTDYAGRKRALTSSLSPKKKTKLKKSSNVGNSSYGIAEPGKASKIQYSNSDSPPYVVYVHSIDDDPTKSYYIISLSVKQIAYSDIEEIKKIGKGKVLAKMTTAKAANDLTNNVRIKKEGLKTFIPIYRTIRTLE